MITARIIIIASLATAVPLGAAWADGVHHLPPADADAGAPIELVAEIADAGARTVVLHYRAQGAGRWNDVTFAQRAGDTWVAAIPGTAVNPPGLEYYLSSTTSVSAADGSPGATVDEFASERDPHPVGVFRSLREQRRDRDLARTAGRRSRAHAAAEYVDFGQRTRDGAVVPDRYYRVDLDFSYKLLAYPLEEIRFGYTRLEGTVPASDRRVPEGCNGTNQDSAMCKVEAGFKVGGWFELGLALAEGVRFDGRGMFTANQESFALGARGELRAGVADGNHVALGFEYMDQVGTSGFFRLGWATVPRLPMAATVEVTDLPNSVRATGVRLVYDIFYPMPTGLRLGARVGYAARDQIIGGPTAGASASFDF